MERCEYYTELLSARLDGELTEEQTRALEAHLAACPVCRGLAEELEALHASFSQLEEIPAPEGFARGVMDRIRAEEKPKVIPLFRRPQFKALAGLAACALVCVGLYQFGAGGGRNAAPESVVFTMATEAPAAEVALDAQDAAAFSAEDMDTVKEPGEAVGGAAEKKDLQVQYTARSEQYDAAPSHYAFQNDQYLRVTWQEELDAPSAQIIGSADRLADFLARFPDDLSAVTDQYGAEYFRTGRLLALVVTEPSGSNRHTLAPQGLLWDQVTVLRQVPEAGDCDMAAWLILAEVDTMFEEGRAMTVVLEED